MIILKVPEEVLLSKMPFPYAQTCNTSTELHLLSLLINRFVPTAGLLLQISWKQNIPQTQRGSKQEHNNASVYGRSV
jgi:hypothetical protein